MTRRAFAALLALSVVFVARGGTVEPVKPMVVVFYADWCMNCKILLPKLAKAQEGLEDRLLFVKLDSTDEARKIASRERAKTLGISELWFVNHATGWAALFDRNRQQVDSLKHEMSVEDLRRHLLELAGPPPKPQKKPRVAAAPAAR
jgi:thiol-disulfide isomerase/thioredoxin